MRWRLKRTHSQGGIVVKKLKAQGSDYGLDAPPAVRNVTVGGIGFLIAGITFFAAFSSAQPQLAISILATGLLGGALLLLTAALLVWSSKVGKLLLREILLGPLALTGSETVVDVGCGRGLLLIAAAKRLSAGKAVGIDLWHGTDLSGNSPEATLANARAEGVADQVEVRTGDMRKLPFGDGTVDAIVSSLAIHNIPDQTGRAEAVREMARVLKPGGQMALLDLRCTDEYVQALRSLGWSSARRSRLRFQMFPPVRIVRAKKPG
jgi:SAM-dependent methyltransferase